MNFSQGLYFLSTSVQICIEVLKIMLNLTGKKNDTCILFNVTALCFALISVMHKSLLVLLVETLWFSFYSLVFQPFLV